MSSVEQISSYIMQAAAARGIDPKTALEVARSEGLYADPKEAWQSSVVKNGKRERSYGPFQLYIDGGLGNQFMEQTGLDPRNANTWMQQVDFALDHAAKNGWSAWYGARNTGIGNMQGIGGASQAIANDTMAALGKAPINQGYVQGDYQGYTPGNYITGQQANQLTAPKEREPFQMKNVLQDPRAFMAQPRNQLAQGGFDAQTNPFLSYLRG